MVGLMGMWYKDMLTKLLFALLLLGSLFAERCTRLGLYFGAWSVFYAVVGLSCAAGLKQVLPYQNPFVNQGVVTAGALVVGAGVFTALLAWRPQQKPWRVGIGIVSSLALGFVFWWPV